MSPCWFRGAYGRERPRHAGKCPSPPALLCAVGPPKKVTQTLPSGSPTCSPCRGHPAWSRGHCGLPLLCAHVSTKASKGHNTGLSGALVHTRNCNGEKSKKGEDPGGRTAGVPPGQGPPRLHLTAGMKSVKPSGQRVLRKGGCF